MTILDWIVLSATLGFIVFYGAWKTRKNKDMKGYFLGNNEMKWTTIGLSVMATQASAITFISTPGQAYESGLGFIQNYFGLPLALIIVAAVFIPIYHKLKVFTAYEYLESRFGVKSRLLAAFFFLLQRGLAAGITIYAPAIILSTALGWNLNLTILLVGLLVIVYTVSGGTKAVSITQKWQMGIIMLGMFIAFGIIVNGLPSDVSFDSALTIAGTLGKLETINLSFDLNERYTLWSGLTGGLFLALSYFGTDQSQVQRYLGGKSVYESRMGLMFNALLKIPMQFFILMVGVMVFVFIQFERPPILFNHTALTEVHATEYTSAMDDLESKHNALWDQKREIVQAIATTDPSTEDLAALKLIENSVSDNRNEAKALLKTAVPTASSKDSDYVFLTFIMNYLPTGLVGLLLAVILSAAMSSTAGELNALASTTTVDFYKRIIKKEGSDRHYLLASKTLTALWGVVAICFALFAHLVENLIEAVNILGSVFYGTILGIFLVAFLFKFIRNSAPFYAALVGQVMVFALYFKYEHVIAYLWYNVIGCLLVMILTLVFHVFMRKQKA